ncbi:transporter substrate-binding domain-containing protein [Neorhizobium sp. NCHU2750]|uniref:transporter substrate-binding domain-containing protein n=1 Tax=Neorhizobium sp. NCHU2750 TaxID=1825976 RepID=UPI000E76ED91|nr:amino acid ABC transporter substrate-binding protein [Neorhizobium sp. NCHU2750]
MFETLTHSGSNGQVRLGGFKRAAVAAVALTAFALNFAPSAKAEGLWDDVKARGVLRCAFASAPPFEMKDVATGEYEGAHLDLCKQFADVLGVKVQFVDTTWDNVVAGLQAGKWDMVPALDRTAPRALAISFSDTVSANETTLTYLKTSKKIVNPPADLSTIDVAGVRIGVISGSANDRALTQRIKNAQIVRLPTSDAVDLAVLSGRIDVAAKATEMNLLLQAAHPDQIALLNPEPALSRLGVGFGLPANTSYHDMQVFNIFIEGKRGMGEIDAAMKHYSEVTVAGAKK